MAAFQPTPFDPNRHCDAKRIISWMDDPRRKSANLEFTEGLERQIAYRVEGMMDSGLLDPDMPVQQLRLHMGELTADEVLVARAAIRWANSRRAEAASHQEQLTVEEQKPPFPDIPMPRTMG